MTRSSHGRRGGRSDGSTWCDQHKRHECSKNTKRGTGRCHRIALAGLDNCGMSGHGGESLAKAKARGQANLMRAAFAEIPANEYVDPGDVLLWAVTVAARQVAWLRSMIADRLAAKGATVDADGISVLVKLEQDERRELTRAAKLALDGNVAERHIRLAERTAEQLVAVLRGVVTELGHNPTDPAVQTVVRRHLQLVAGTGTGGP